MTTLREALHAARACIQQDRTAFADSNVLYDGTFYDEEAEQLAEYDAVLAQIDAALAAPPLPPRPSRSMIPDEIRLLTAALPNAKTPRTKVLVPVGPLRRVLIYLGLCRQWIREMGDRTDTCTFHILGDVCGDCRCGRKGKESNA